MWRSVDGEVIALDAVKSEYLAVAGSGAILWEALARGTTEAELRELLCSRYDVEPERAERDIARFLDELRRAGLLDGAETGEARTS